MAFSQQSSWVWISATVLIGMVNGLGQIFMRMDSRELRFAELFSGRGLASFPRWWIGLLLCWFCGLAYAVVVTRLRLGVAVPVFIGTMYLAVTVFSSLFLRESIQGRDALAFAAIAIGIAMLVKS